MALFDLMQNAIVNSVISQNTGLSKITSTTFSQVGTSINNVRTQAFSDVNSSLNNVNYNSQLYDPINQMGNFALSNSTGPAQTTAINNAISNATAAVDSTFNSSIPNASGLTAFDVQSAATNSIGTGISSMGSALGSINGALVAPALSLGNAALVNAGNLANSLTNGIFNAATNSVNNSVAAINSSVANLVAAKNSIGSAVGNALGSGSSLAGNSTSNPFTNAGLSAVDEGAVDGTKNNTDIIYQDIKVYIEGVQVPFEAVSISQGIGTLPTAMIQIPSQPGLLDICRYYQPKVHIFYTDKNFGGDRLLFWGHIAATNYVRSRSNNIVSVSFHCDHKNALLTTVTLEFSGYASNATTILNDPNPDQATAKVAYLNSQLAIIQALQGLTGVQSADADLLDPSNKNVLQADVTKLSKRFANFEKRLEGLPSAIMNFWNQLKKQCYADVTLNTIMADMYIPLVEEGLAFFDRMAGHYMLEDIVNNTKQDYCPGGVTPTATANPVMVPPAYRLNSISAIQSSLAVSTIGNMLGFSGELTNFLQMFSDFYSSVEYEILTLASPAEIPADPTVDVNIDVPSTYATVNKMAIETVIKPQVPFYYSPVCNVIFPKMFHTINVSQDELQIPSRLSAFSDIVPGDQGQIGSQYRAPNSIRESVAYGAVLSNAVKGTNLQVDLQGTTGQSFNVPGKYEIGRGVRHKRISLPNWLAQLLKGKIQELGDPNTEAWPDKSSADYQALCDLHAAWIDRYGYDVNVYDDGTSERVRNTDKDSLDPYSQKSSIHPFQRLLFSTADYEYTKAVVSSRVGTIDALFNPYVIPGYPMEILDDSPNAQCFHAMCSSVTHTFTSRSIGTSIGFVAACSYTEMVNYFMQPIHPWLQTALNIVNTKPGQSGLSSISGDGYGNPPDDIQVNSTILFNSTAKATADIFYKQVLGVPSAAIDELFDFQMGRVIPVKRVNGLLTESTETSKPAPNGGEQNDFLTAVGNMRLVMRPIEGKKSIETKFGIKFIDLTPSNYNPTSIQYQNPQLDNKILLEPGASIFLDYLETKDFIADSDATADTASTTTSATTGSGAPIAFGEA